MTYIITKQTPAMRYDIGMTFDTLADARWYLSGVLAEYKKDYGPRHARRGYGVRSCCGWASDKRAVYVRAINDDDMPGDNVGYHIIRE